MGTQSFLRTVATGLVFAAAIGLSPAGAQSFVLGYAPVSLAPSPFMQPQRQLAPEPEADLATPADPALARRIVSYHTSAGPGTVIVDTANTSLYYVLGGGKAIRYAIGVGREGFTWSGTQSVTRKAEWPDWVPPPEMIARQPYLPRWIAGGETNPLGARSLYLGNTAYRIHGTNAPDTIGRRVSSGCIRMLNADVIDLYSRVDVGAKVIVLPNGSRTATLAQSR